MSAGLPRGALMTSAHEHCSHHPDEVRHSEVCGCFYCLKVFSPAEINEWVDSHETAVCPYRGIDAVIGDRSGFAVRDAGLLGSMHAEWFSKGLTINA